VSFGAYVLPDPDHAVLVLTGDVEAGCADRLREALAESECHDRGHVIVDLRQVSGMSATMVSTLLWELGRAFDDDRTMRLVIRGEHQIHILDQRGLAGMVPVHTTLDAAMKAADAASAGGLTTRARRRVAARRRQRRRSAPYLGPRRSA
jgi:anti-sigma B factor antagonist